MISIIYSLLKETAMTMALKLSSRALVERFATRLVLYGLEKLRSGVHNRVTQDTVSDIITLLKGKSLRLIDEKSNR